MRGHEEASGTKYVPKELMDFWAKKDPISNYEQFLLKEKACDQKQLDSIKSEIKKEINKAVKKAFAEPAIESNSQIEISDTYYPLEQRTIAPKGFFL